MYALMACLVSAASCRVGYGDILSRIGLNASPFPENLRNCSSLLLLANLRAGKRQIAHSALETAEASIPSRISRTPYVAS